MRKSVQFVLHPDTQDPVDGLRIHKPSKRYYRIAEDGKSRQYYRKNGLKNSAYLRRAIFEHECWRNGQNPAETETVVTTKPAFDDFGTEQRATLAVYADGTEQMERYIHPDDLADYFRAQLSNPETRIDFANRLRMPELLRLDTLRPAQDSMSLVNVGDLYHTKNDMRDKSRRNSRTYWTEFVEFLGVRLVSEIAPHHIEQFHDEMMSRYQNGRSRSYLINRYGTIKAIFNFASKRGKDSQHIATVQAYLKMLSVPKQTIRQKKEAKKRICPIKPEHFHKLLEAADIQWKAILLISLNCGFYPVDICNLESTDVDLKAHSLTDFRSKTGMDRAAWLWPETVQAIRAYLADDPHNDPHLFVTRYGTGFKGPSSLIYTFHKIRETSGIPVSVEFAHIRDGSATNAGSDLQATKILLGHTMGGETNKYIERTPAKAKPACMAIHRHYFPKIRKKGNK